MSLFQISSFNFNHPLSYRKQNPLLSDQLFHPNELSITTRVRKDEMEITLLGQLRASTMERIDEFLLQYKPILSRCKRLFVDVNHLNYISQIGLRSLVDLVSVAKDEGIDITFSKDDSSVSRVLTQMGFYRWVKS